MFAIEILHDITLQYVFKNKDVLFLCFVSLMSLHCRNIETIRQPLNLKKPDLEVKTAWMKLHLISFLQPEHSKHFNCADTPTSI